MSEQEQRELSPLEAYLIRVREGIAEQAESLEERIDAEANHQAELAAAIEESEGRVRRLSAALDALSNGRGPDEMLPVHRRDTEALGRDVLTAKPPSEKVQGQVLAFVREHPNASTKEVTEGTRISRSAVRHTLEFLRGQEALRLSGSTPGGGRRYTVMPGI